MKAEQDGIVIEISGAKIDQIEQIQIYFRGWRDGLDRATTITTYGEKGETNVTD